MRRSLAPSQKHKLLENKSTGTSDRTKHPSDGNDENMVTIQRLPLFGFLEIPKSLSQQFKVPTGCVLTEKSIALRKVKRLGTPKNFQIVRPGDYANTLVKHTGPSSEENDDGDNEEEGLPTNVSSLPPFEPLVLWSHPEDPDNKVEVIPQLACKLRPHQREGVQFLFECTMGLRGFEGQGCILADDMGLGKTLMSITLLWTLLNQGFANSSASAVRKIVVVCPTSLVGNWDNEIRKWVGEHCPTFAVKTEPKKMIKTFLMHRGKGVLIVSYETLRLYSKLFEAAGKPSILNKTVPADSVEELGAISVVNRPGPGFDYLSRHSNNNVCDLLICDEAHKLKNADSGLSKSLNMLPARKRILLSGTPMQNELTEFYNMVNFCNPNVLGTNAEFKKRYERPILLSREPDATEKQVAQAAVLQKELSTVVNEFILKRGNILNAQHLPPKLVQFVCCRLTPLQESLYTHLLNSKEIRHAREGKQLDTLGAIRQLINICSHPKLLLDTFHAKQQCNEPVSEELVALVDIIRQYNSNNNNSGGGSSGSGGPGTGSGITNGKTPTPGLTRLGMLNPQKAAEMRNFSLKKGFNPSAASSQDRLDPELSGKMAVLARMLQTLRLGPERIVIVSNYTQTLDLIQALCVQSNYPVLRLDGSISANKRTSVVDQFNNPHSGAFVFLLSSKAGGCGINLIGGSRLVLFDPDWNPASDKQAAARIWREGQKRRCFIYRFMSTGSIEEKIIQRQLSKEGLADIVDDKEQVNQFSSDELRDLFSLRLDTASDTHDTLRCKRCSSVRVREAAGRRSGKGPAFTPPQCEACRHFVDTFARHLQQEAFLHAARLSNNASASDAVNSANEIVLPFAEELAALQEGLASGLYPSLPVFGKALRECMQSIEAMLVQSRNYKKPPVIDSAEDPSHEAPSAEELAEAAAYESYARLFPSSFSIFSQFLSRWVEAVPELTLLGKTDAVSAGQQMSSNSSSGKASGDADEDVGESEFVEQEGCPEDTDFNRWSHHTSVGTCEDELLQHSLGDSTAVSFVFGLEVNWSLLESREAQYREENELRKEQQRLDLEALNEQRRLKREGLLNPTGTSGKNAKKTQRDGADGSSCDSDASNLSDDQAERAGRKEKSSSARKKRKSGSSDAAEAVEGIDPQFVLHDQQEGSAKKAKKSADAASEKSKKEKKRKSNVDDGSLWEEKSQKEITSSGTAATNGATGAKKAKVWTSLSPASVTAATTTPSAKATITTTSSRRASASNTASGLPLDPLQEVDHTFQADWEFLRRAHSKGKIASFRDFHQVMKQLKIFNNNWRVVPANYSNLATPTMYTRMPGLKIDTCGNYQLGFDYFVGDEALMRFMYTQATLLGDNALVREALQALDNQQKGKEQECIESAPVLSSAAPTIDEVVEKKALVQRASSSMKKKIVCDSDDDSCGDVNVQGKLKGNSPSARASASNPTPAVPMAATASVASVVKKKLFASAPITDEIDFGDTDEDDANVVVSMPRSERGLQRPQSLDEKVQAVVAKKPARRPIADSDDDEDDAGGDVTIKTADAQRRSVAHSSKTASATDSSSVRGSAVKKFDRSTPSSSASKAYKGRAEVLDLTSPTQHSPITLEANQQGKEQEQKQRQPTHSSASTAPAPVSATSTALPAPPRSTLSILNAALKARQVYKGQENLPPNVRAAAAVVPAVSISSTSVAPAGPPPASSMTKYKDKEKDRDLNRDNLRGRPDVHDSQKGGSSRSDSSSGDGSDSFSQQLERESADETGTWTCSFCTLLNTVTDAPTDCALCGNRRSFNHRPKRLSQTAVSSLSQASR